MDDLIVEIVSTQDLEATEWNDFVASIPESTFFCTSDWWSAFEDSFFLIVRSNIGEIVSGMPFRIASVIPLIGRLFRFGWSDSSALVSEKFDEEETFRLKQLTINALVAYLKGKVIAFTISSKVRSSDAKLLMNLGFYIERCSTLIIDLSKDLDVIYKSFSKGNKSSVHKGEVLGVEVKINEGISGYPYISDYCRLQRSLFDRKKRGYSDIYYKDESYLRTILGSHYNRVYLAMAYYNGMPAAGAVLISCKKQLYYYLGASDSAVTRISQASNYLHYEIIKFAKADGFLSYDFGNIPFTTHSDKPDYGVYIFKNGFGGIRYEYDHGNLILNKFKYWIIWRLRQAENSPILIFFYRLLKR